MATVVQFKRVLADAAGLEDRAEVAIGSTGFKGDGQRMFLQWNGTGILLDHGDARAFLAAAARIAKELDCDE